MLRYLQRVITACSAVPLVSQATICGDARITPFYEIEDVMAKLRSYAADIQADIESLPHRGPCSRCA